MEQPYTDGPGRRPDTGRPRSAQPRPAGQRPAQPRPAGQRPAQPPRHRPPNQPPRRGMPQNTPNRRRRRRGRRKSVFWELLLDISIIFFAGFLVGFLFRGYLWDREVPFETLPPPSTTMGTVPQTTGPAETEPPPEPETNQWQPILVNIDHPLPEDYQPELVELDNGLQVERSCYADLMAMLSDCQAAGLSPVVSSGYRSMQKQVQLYERKVQGLMEEGFDEASARAQASDVVAIPGTSEYQSGLAVAIVDESYQILDEKQADTPVQRWLLEHCWEYGFILRNPEGKRAITGYAYEPWHYRYVGREYAQQIRASGLCLEEWLEQR